MFVRLRERFGLLSDKTVKRLYTEAGTTFGDAVSYLYMGECVGFREMLEAWRKWEKEYANRGYRTVSLNAFVNAGGYDVSLQGLGEKCVDGEEIVLHAELFLEQHAEPIPPAVDMERLLDGSVQIGSYEVPSTTKMTD